MVDNAWFFCGKCRLNIPYIDGLGYAENISFIWIEKKTLFRQNYAKKNQETGVVGHWQKITLGTLSCVPKNISARFHLLGSMTWRTQGAASGEATKTPYRFEHIGKFHLPSIQKNQQTCQTLLGFQVLSKQENHLVSWLTNSAQKNTWLCDILQGRISPTWKIIVRFWVISRITACKFLDSQLLALQVWHLGVTFRKFHPIWVENNLWTPKNGKFPKKGTTSILLHST